MKIAKWVALIGVAIVMMFPLYADAAWTVAASIDQNAKWGEDANPTMTSYRVKIEVVADGSDVAEFNLSDYLSGAEMAKISGGMLMKVCTVPSATAAPTTYTLAMDDELGADLPITVTTTSTTAAECFYPTESVIAYDYQFDFPDIGDANDAATVYLHILK